MRPLCIEGYVNKYNTISTLITVSDCETPYREMIMPGAFEKAIREARDVILNVNHIRTIGSISGGELELKEDRVGLYAKCIVIDRQLIDDALADRIRGWSFEFLPVSDQWNRGGEVKIRSVYRLELRAVTLITGSRNPAYPETTVKFQFLSSKEKR